jgi:hypothetical protein
MSIPSTTMRLILLAFGILSIAQSIAAAAEPPAIKVGARVRVEATVPSLYGDYTKKVTGPLLDINEASITVENALTGAVSVFSWKKVSKLELSINGPQRGRGALLGLGIGAPIGFAVGFVSIGEDDLLEPAGAGVILALLFGATGALIGAAVAPGEQWESVPLDQAFRGFDHGRQRGGGIFVSVSY